MLEGVDWPTMPDLGSVLDGVTSGLDWLADEAPYWIDSLAALDYDAVPVWVWAIVGVVIWRLVFKAIRAPFRRGRGTPGRRRAAWLQKQAVRGRHKAWEREAKQVLKTLRKGIPGEQIGPMLQDMSPYAFEYLITEGLKGKGVKVRKIQRASGDGGIDGMAHVEGRWHLIQAKRYSSPVASQIIEEFVGVCQERRMPGLFVASNGFTMPARLAAKRSKRLKLMDGRQLVKAIR
ncbi:MAG: restriction endonuclease [Marinobacter sp. T13-3]|nr:MAG: restriction endonuclease [Marinobacter sp. T13-3]